MKTAKIQYVSAAMSLLTVHEKGQETVTQRLDGADPIRDADFCLIAAHGAHEGLQWSEIALGVAVVTY